MCKHRLFGQVCVSMNLFRYFSNARISPSSPRFQFRASSSRLQYHRNRVAPILQSLRFVQGIQFVRSIRKPSKRKLPCAARSWALKRQGCSEGRNNVVGWSYLALSVFPVTLSSPPTCYSLSSKHTTLQVNVEPTL